LAQDIVASAQGPWPSHPDVASFSCYLGASTHADGQVVVDLCVSSSCGWEIILSPPRQGLKMPWDASPLPPHLGVAPSSCCYGGLHPNSQLEVHTKSDGVVVGCNPLSAGDPQVATDSFLCIVYHVKCSEVTLLELLCIRVVGETLMGCAARSKAPRRLRLPYLQVLQVVEEVKVLSSLAHVSACLSLVSPPRSFAIVFWSLQMSQVVCLRLFGSCRWSFSFAA
jgi:hypothetical protein